MTERIAFDIDDPRLATAAWSRIAEPEDGAASVLVRSVGPVAALRWLLDSAADGGSGQAPLLVELGPAETKLGGQAHGGVPRVAAAAQPALWGQIEAGGGLARAVARWRPRLEGLDPRRELRVLERLGGRLLTPEDRTWPVGLTDLGDLAPLCLWIIGQPAAQEQVGDLLARSVGVVGSRACTRYGEAVTADLVGGLVERGWAVISGGAFGIDAAAHRAALGCGGITAAVMAGGLDILYPQGNARLLENVMACGLLISEVPPGSAHRRERFLSRNRLIAAMSQATVVVEAGWRSGAQNTARRAADLMRGVGAVPGPVTSAASAGCHRLIRDGVATCVTDADEVEALALPLADSLLVPQPPGRSGVLDDLPGRERRVLDSLPIRKEASATHLAAVAGLAPTEVLAALAQLERRGAVSRAQTGWRRCRA